MYYSYVVFILFIRNITIYGPACCLVTIRSFQLLIVTALAHSDCESYRYLTRSRCWTVDTVPFSYRKIPVLRIMALC